jgi:DNA-binding Lrp family transcriptional regulator
MLSEKEKSILLYISEYGLSVSQQPFLKVAETLNIREDEVIDILRNLKQKGIIKDLRGVINHTEAGYEENALIAWAVPDNKIDALTNIFINNNNISHCYERAMHENFQYNIFTMMHTREKKLIMDFVSSIKKDFSVECELLFTEKELKKEKLDIRELLCATL